MRAKSAFDGLNSGAARTSTRVAVPDTPIAVSWMLMADNAFWKACAGQHRQGSSCTG